ncbi:MAG TPA: M15 family metallopeptidase [Steroidobacteraceae bacterium]|jgi:D-alanyl-D-alanine dipeptidase
MIFRAVPAAFVVLVGAAFSCVAADPAVKISPASTATAAGMIDMRSLVPDFSVDMRYAGSDNFVGTPVDGYEAPRCFLLRPVAEALQRVELALRKQHMRLRVFDCYRPVRAVRHFVRWASDLEDQRTKSAHYPALDKRVLLGDYIASTSGHSRGATTDLTLMECERQQCAPLDMGTDFDFFDARAHTDAPDVTPVQHENRLRLRDAMEREGFQNYTHEWWHYTFRPEPSPEVAFDFVVK